MSLSSILATISKLEKSQSVLRTNLQSKGLSAVNDDHFPQLSPMVAEIEDKSYACEGTTMLVSSNGALTISNLPQKPKEAGILAQDLYSATITSVTGGYVSPAVLVVFPDDSDMVQIEECVVTRALNEESNTYSVTFSYEAYNAEHPDSPIWFHGGYTYTWLALFHSLYVEESE